MAFGLVALGSVIGLIPWLWVLRKPLNVSFIVVTEQNDLRKNQEFLRVRLHNPSNNPLRISTVENVFENGTKEKAISSRMLSRPTFPKTIPADDAVDIFLCRMFPKLRAIVAIEIALEGKSATRRMIPQKERQWLKMAEHVVS